MQSAKVSSLPLLFFNSYIYKILLVATATAQSASNASGVVVLRRDVL